MKDEKEKEKKKEKKKKMVEKKKKKKKVELAGVVNEHDGAPTSTTSRRTNPVGEVDPVAQPQPKDEMLKEGPPAGASAVVRSGGKKGQSGAVRAAPDCPSLPASVDEAPAPMYYSVGGGSGAHVLNRPSSCFPRDRAADEVGLVVMDGPCTSAGGGGRSAVHNGLRGGECTCCTAPQRRRRDAAERAGRWQGYLGWQVHRGPRDGAEKEEVGDRCRAA